MTVDRRTGDALLTRAPMDAGVAPVLAEARPVARLAPSRVAGGSPPRQGSHASLRSAARLAVLVVLAVGFLAMHGFVAVSAGADTHAAHPGQVSRPESGAATHGTARTTGPAETTTTAGVTGAPSASVGCDEPCSVSAGAPPTDRDLPGPTEHHGVLAGCVVALVGVVVLVAALFFVQGHPRAAVPRARAVDLPRRPLSGRARGLPPLRLRLCVIRV